MSVFGPVLPHPWRWRAGGSETAVQARGELSGKWPAMRGIWYFLTLTGVRILGGGFEMVQALAPGDPGYVGKYRLVGRIGRGGMGQVFLGQSPGGRMVAVKLIRADLASDPDFRARFAREVTTARTVSGIFTVPVVDADVDGPQPWLVTAFVDGPSLADAFLFLCPNGHRLNAPARLEGHAGQCPQCGARFLVPVIGDLDQVEEVTLTDIGDHEGGPLASTNFGSQTVPAVHSLCKLMRQLWEEKQHGGVVEIHLEGGTMLTPDWFDERLCANRTACSPRKRPTAR